MQKGPSGFTRHQIAAEGKSGLICAFYDLKPGELDLGIQLSGGEKIHEWRFAEQLHQRQSKAAHKVELQTSGLVAHKRFLR